MTVGSAYASPVSESRPLVVLPTYNEAENLDAVLDRILADAPGFDVLVVDDASPDGTGAMADARAARNSRIHVLHRPGKEGLGRAYVAGFRWGLAAEAGYTHLCEMDADLSHDPADLPRLLAATRPEGADADLAIGSRYIEGGSISGWGLGRRVLSRGGGLYAKTLLGLPVEDPTSGFRCFRRNVLETLALDDVECHGYGFQIEMTLRVAQAGFRIVEVPIHFTDRTRGTSKMDARIAVEAATFVLRLRLRRGRRRAR
ncbi:MAG: polyprenol monophosphomannose synthase [Deltaproteobacteria bacterium]|nr:MAG: polyprenol monophosphomannose synthase [Deltaproteobacteria bacterium]